MVRPLVNLLHTDRDGMQNFEALRGLTNLAGFSEKLRYDFATSYGNKGSERHNRDKQHYSHHTVVILWYSICIEG